MGERVMLCRGNRSATKEEAAPHETCIPVAFIRIRKYVCATGMR